jgi:hypothetical protein
MKKGFKQKSTAAREGLPLARAGAVLASATRKATPKQKRVKK